MLFKKLGNASCTCPAAIYLNEIFWHLLERKHFLEKMRDVCKLWIAILQFFECLIPWRRVCYMLSYRLVYLGFHQNKCHTTPHHIKHKLYNFGYIKNNIGILHLITSKGNILRVWKFSKTQPRPVAKNATLRPSVRIELKHLHTRKISLSFSL